MLVVWSRLFDGGCGYECAVIQGVALSVTDDVRTNSAVSMEIRLVGSLVEC